MSYLPWLAGGAALGLAARRGRRGALATMRQAELHVYDFDGTLFRSPSPPAVWARDWWSDGQSLLPPCVPAIPGARWWNAATVKSARRSIANPNVFAAMLTGRQDTGVLGYRIPDLLHQRGLNFDAVHLDPGGNALTNKVLLAFPSMQCCMISTRVADST